MASTLARMHLPYPTFLISNLLRESKRPAPTLGKLLTPVPTLVPISTGEPEVLIAHRLRQDSLVFLALVRCDLGRPGTPERYAKVRRLGAGGDVGLRAELGDGKVGPGLCAERFLCADGLVGRGGSDHSEEEDEGEERGELHCDWVCWWC